ncbi:MAG: CRISPR system Cmr subunit Cmr5 [Lysobacteraceae bacterium]|nr:MAG: CRISPR system Cmr subunit Cmr5 [Xanthomonadaceae bacterium]
MKTRTQRFAEAALAAVKAVGQAHQREYKARADGFPVMVMQSGLTQALGFLIGKGDVCRQYADDVARILGRANAMELQDAALGADLAEYRRLTREVLEVAALIKRYGQVHLKPLATSEEVSHAG